MVLTLANMTTHVASKVGLHLILARDLQPQLGVGHFSYAMLKADHVLAT